MARRPFPPRSPMGSSARPVTRGARLAALALVSALLLAACSSTSTTRSASEADPTESTVVLDTSTTTSTVASDVDASTTTSTTSTTSTTTTEPQSTTTSEPESSTTTTTIVEPPEPTSLVAPCATRVVMGPLEMRAMSEDTCLRRVGLEWTTDQPVLVGGIEFRPTSETSRVRFDPFNARVAATGYRALGSVLGVPLVIAEGVIDWSFQYSPNQNGPVGSSMPVASDTVNLATVARLPGLSGVQSFPKQPINGFADYTVVTDASVEQLAGRFPSLLTDEVSFPLDAIGLRTIPEYTISIPTVLVQKIAGLNVSGSFTLQPTTREGALGITARAELQLPDWLSGFKGRFGAFFPVAGSTRIETLLIEIPEVDLEVVRFQDVYLDYRYAEQKWVGRAGVQVGSGADAVGLQGGLSIVDGRLQRVSVALTGLPINVGGGSINALGGTLSLEPVGIRATAQIGLGPYVSKVGNIAVIDGEVAIDTEELSMAGEMTIGKVVVGSLELKGLEVADARIAYYWNGLFNIEGNARFFLDSAETWGIAGGLRGGATADELSLGGNVRVRLGPLVTLGGTAAVSTRGWIGCASVNGLWFGESRIGVSYDWGAESAVLRGNDCNSDEYQVPVRPEGTTGSTGRNATVADDGVDVDVRPGQRMVSFAVDGGGAVITAPDGTRITVTGREQSDLDDPANPRWMVVRQPTSDVAYVYYAQPQAGTWSVEPLDAAAVPVVTAAVVSDKSRPLDATTAELHPTSTSGLDLAEPAGTTEVTEVWLRALLVLLALALALVLVAGTLRGSGRRSRA